MIKWQSGPEDISNVGTQSPDAGPIAILAAWFVLLALATGVWRNVPLIDDWTYAWSVEHLLQTGTIKILDWSSTYGVAQALWGAAWSALLGFSFASLHISTLVLGAGGCIALYLMLRELDAPPRMALIGGLSLAVNPVFAFLSSSFMTDVPFITFTTFALLCYVRAASRREVAPLWWGGVWSLAAFLVRQVGIIIPAAGIPLLLARPMRPPMTRARVATALLTTWAAIGLFWIDMRQFLGTTSVMQKWLWNLDARPASYVRLNVFLVLLVSFYLLPALLAAASGRLLHRRPGVMAAGVVAAALPLVGATGSVPLPLGKDQTWSLLEVGASRALVDGHLAINHSAWMTGALRAGGLLAFTLVVVLSVGRRGPLHTALNAVVGRDWAVARAPLLAFLAAYLVLTNLLWMYHDRYYLALAPPLIAVLLGVPDARPRFPRAAVCALALFGAIALVGTRDALRFNQAVGDAWHTLVDAGVPPAEIDAGYAWNGWMLYAHPSNLEPGMSPLADVPWVTSTRHPKYAISTAPLDGYAVERSISWSSLPWPGPDRLLVLKKIAAAGVTEPVHAGRAP